MIRTMHSVLLKLVTMALVLVALFPTPGTSQVRLPAAPDAASLDTASAKIRKSNLGGPTDGA